MSNTNCLEGMQCPDEECKSYGPFRIEVVTVVTMYDNGSGNTEDMDWGDDSFCECKECRLSGKVKDFQAKGEMT